jgi:hypothetical protein
MGNALPRTLDMKLNDTDSYLYQQVTRSAIHLEAPVLSHDWPMMPRHHLIDSGTCRESDLVCLSFSPALTS